MLFVPRKMVLWSRRFSLHSSVVQLLLCFLPVVTPLIDQICVNAGFENLRYTSSPLYVLVSSVYQNQSSPNKFCEYLLQSTGDAKESAHSIGGKKFRSSWKGPATLSFNKAALGIHLDDNMLEDCCTLYNDKKADITIYGVKHKNRFLNGWLMIHINIKVEVDWLFVQVSDESGNAIGEFVHSSDSSACRPDDNHRSGASVIPKVQQFLPCTATGLQEARPSQAFVYTRKSLITSETSHAVAMDPEYVDTYMTSPSNLIEGLQMSLTWRLNEYYCNRHAKFRVTLYFAVTVDPSIPSPHQMTVFHRAQWLYPKWFGVADIIPKHERSKRPDCKTKITQSMINSNSDFWIKKIEDSTQSNDNIKSDNVETEGPGFPPTLYKSCRTYLTRLEEYTEIVPLQPNYGGRCEKIDEKKFKPAYYTKIPHSESSVDIFHQCLKNKHAEYPKTMENYKTYVEKKIKNRKELCSEKAAKCPSLDILKRNIRIELRSMHRPQYRAFNATGRYILRSRAYHGAMFILATLFFVPISNFMARFFKETFLADDILGIRVWYFVHIGLTFLAINVSVSGLISNGKVTRVWGKSWSAAGRAHRATGWTCIALYVLVLILGPVRPQRQWPRLIMMILHSFLGYFQYFMGLFTLMNSALVPGSPSATMCYKKILDFDPFVSPNPFDTYNHEIATAVTWWMCLDLLFYGLMSFMQRKADMSWEVSRKYYFPLVPIVHHNDRRSFKCFRYRSLVLVIYIFILSIIVIVTIARLYTADWKGCDCGPMTCTHANLTPASVYPEVQCGGLAVVRALREKSNH